jgi:UDP-N-acetylglucosamine 2-epimerase (non-hydrolysing)
MKTILHSFRYKARGDQDGPGGTSRFRRYQQVKLIVCMTGRRQEMLRGVLELFDIRPDVDLKVMKEGQDLPDLTSVILCQVRDVIKKFNPDIVLVHGDTTTTLAASLAAFYRKVPIGHMKPGFAPQPLQPLAREGDRSIVGRLATFHFAPTMTNRDNLIAEGVAPDKIYITGNTVIDALYFVLEQFKLDKARQIKSEREISTAGYTLSSRQIILITGHRRENFGTGFNNIFLAIKVLANRYPFVDFVYPVHLNPGVTGPTRLILGGVSNIYLIRPLTYEPFVWLMKRSHFIVTDSGGIQEEGPSLGKPVIVTRDATERPEGIEAGTVRLVGTDIELLVSCASNLLDQPDSYKLMCRAHNPYGDGQSANRITSSLLKNLDLNVDGWVD